MAKAKKKTRLEELQEYARGVGLTVRTWSPGDGVTRYRFFDRPGPGQTYFGPASATYTALGLKDAWNYAYGYGGGSGASRSGGSHARKKKISPQEAKQLLVSDGIDFGRDFHELSSYDVQRVLEVAKLAGYRKRPDAPGSTARMFYQHLSRQRSHATAKSARHTVYDLVEVNNRTGKERVLHEHFSTKEDAEEARAEYRETGRTDVGYRIRSRKIAAPAYRWNPED